jgi:N-acetylglucosamine-6-sulfatase
VYLNHGLNGGSDGFRRFGDDRSTIATWLQQAGYTTALFGKYLNGYHAPYVPPGWTIFDAFNHGELYWGGQLAENGRVVHFPKSDYSTTYLGRMAVRFIDHQSTGKPFFLYYAPYTPHQPATPAPRYARMRFPGLAHRLTSDPAYYPHTVAGSPPYVRHAPPDTPKADANAYLFALHQLQSLQSLDDQVANIVQALRRTGRLRDTVIIYTSDNGVMWGEHRMIPASKSVPYEGAIHVPLVIRWDATGRRGLVDSDLVANLDLAPTIAQIAGIRKPFTDGRSFEALITGRGRWRECPVLVEHQYDTGEWTIAKAPGFCAVRARHYMFAHYSHGFEELYNLRTDPYEMHNLVHAEPIVAAGLRAETERLCHPRPPGFTW